MAHITGVVGMRRERAGSVLQLSPKLTGRKKMNEKRMQTRSCPAGRQTDGKSAVPTKKVMKGRRKR